MKKELLSLTLNNLGEELIKLNLPAYRAKQLYEWLHIKRIESLEQATNLPKSLKNMIAERFTFEYPTVAKTQIDSDGTTKYLLRYPDGNCVESVLMHHRHGDSLCISTQFGCKMGCKFCASTGAGFVRGLTVAELLTQVYLIANRATTPPRYLVLMGIGEPLDNYDNVISFLRLLMDENGYNIAGRNVSLSSCGLVPEIKRLMQEKLQLTLSISLHRTTDKSRVEVMPIARKYPLSDLIKAVYDYGDETGRRVSIEYAVDPGVNDGRDDVKRLKEMFFGRNIHINLIPLNPIDGKKNADGNAASELEKKLTSQGLSCTVRRRLGTGIDAACGQLRRKSIE